MNTKLITMFHKALADKDAAKNFAKVNEVAMKYGYIIHPDCCTKDVAKWLKEQSFNPNATFYKTWQDITSKTRFELLVDQLIHYATTYGTDLALGNGYVPNDEPVKIPYEQFKMILPATKEEIFELCFGMLKSGIALKDDTINVIVEYFTEYGFVDNVNLDEVSNKEAQAVISAKLNKLPNDEFGMLRCIVYRYTGSAMLIKDRVTINTIIGKNGFQYSRKGTFDFTTLSEEQLIKLSRIFLRYKKIFLAMKDGNNNAAINKIRRYADKYHTPLKAGFWESCLLEEHQKLSEISLAQAEKEVESLNNYRKIQLMQALKERLLGKDKKGKMFIIRNGKMFVRDDYKAFCNVNYIARLYKLLETSLIDSLSKKVQGYSVLLPKGVELSCPTSEKNFIGNYPFGSYVPMNGDHNVFGIYWRNEWGAHDLDLWFTDNDGHRYGWCSGYTDGKTIVFSGDMTNADPEATELFYLGKDVAEGNVGVNIFGGNSKAKFKLFIANENCCNAIEARNKYDWELRNKKPVMCNPNNIVFEAELSFKEGGLKKIGVISDGKIVFADLGAGYGRISDAKAADIIHQQMKNKVESYIDLKPILQKAGANVIYELPKVPDPDDETKEITLTADDFECIDLSNPTRDDLIKLFA